MLLCFIAEGPTGSAQNLGTGFLTDRARSLGIEIHRECEVRGLVQQADRVEVAWASASGEGHIRCSYLVGCDGGRSAVRKLAGFDFPGADPTLTMYQALAKVDHPERLLPHGFRYTSNGMFLSFLGRIITMDFSGPPKDRHAPVTREEFEAVREMAVKARDENEKLQARIAALEARLSGDERQVNHGHD